MTVVFPDAISHGDIMACDSKLISAGFVRPDGTAYGGSVSMGVDSRQIDGGIIMEVRTPRPKPGVDSRQIDGEIIH